MPFTNADWLPSYDELTVPEIEMSAAPLRAGSHHFGKFCDHQCKEFMLCMAEEKDPRKCINEGKEVTRCGVDFFQKLKNTCAEEFASYWTCLDHARFDMHFKECRKPRGIFDKCVFEKLGMEKPELGYFSKIRVHDTRRPKPKREIPLPDPTPEPPRPEDMPVPDSAKQGSRFIFYP
ncbi:NADH dehydrogenase [ubiquinone] 1 alpha subcomplex subunit 8 [Lamellibrachia satsuma]|nr:NADH dehydrogenase [ubiquinone] 1 alpha subcomplex subunit 8 [Lamellibrachia satsuma]